LVIEGQCGESSDTLLVTKNEIVTINCNIKTVNYTKITWFYGPHTQKLIIVAHRHGKDHVYPADPPKTQFNHTDYVYNTEDSSLTIHGSKIDFNVCYECEAKTSNKHHYESYNLQLSGNIIYDRYPFKCTTCM
jgi:hypothetical protein